VLAGLSSFPRLFRREKGVALSSLCSHESWTEIVTTDNEMESPTRRGKASEGRVLNIRSGKLNRIIPSLEQNDTLDDEEMRGGKQ